MEDQVLKRFSSLKKSGKVRGSVLKEVQKMNF
jgi:hypothetical protein